MTEHSAARPATTAAPSPEPSPEPTPGSSDDGLNELVGTWLDTHAVAEQISVPVSRVHWMIREHQLAGAVPTPRAGLHVPADLLDGPEVVKGVPGLLTVLHDGAYEDREILRWLFTPDDTLPGRPIDALRENRGSEVKRRAQAMAL